MSRTTGRPDGRPEGRIDGQPEGRLTGRTAVVTGGARGLGKAIVERFLDEGARVAIWDPKAAERADEFSGYGDRVLLESVDISDSAQADAAAARVRRELGPIQILVNNAGVAAALEPWNVDDESWHRIMRINADGTFFATRACLPDMREGGYGKIVNISSIAALNGRPSTHPAYSASKAAVLGLVASLSRNLGPSGICVNGIMPGFIRTEIHVDFTDEQMAVFGADIPLPRMGTPLDIANAALFLACSESDYVNGAFLNVNGGAIVG